MNRLRPAAVALAACLIAAPAAAQVAAPTTEKIDYDAIYKIKDEGFTHSQVMDTASWLTDVYGARLTGSPNIKAAGDWAVKKLTEWGGQNARLETWGDFGTGWQNTRFSATVITPNPWTILGAPKAWTPGTDGPVTADAVYAPLATDADLERWKGKLKGKIVLAMPIREVKASFDPLAKRYTDDELKKLEDIDPTGGQRRQYDRSQLTFGVKRLQFLADEGVLASFEPSRGGDGGTIFVQQGGAYNPTAPQTFIRFPANVPPQVVLAAEHYNRLARTLDKNVPVSIELNIKNETQPNQTAFNVIAELPGTDKADEIVMLGAHFDSWHSGTGATDNGAGSAVMMEAFRILKASGVKLRRTVRIALWSGEEEGLLGSRAYVKNTFADRDDDGAEAGAGQDHRLLQRGQRHRRHPRRLPAGERGRGADLLRLDGALQEPRHDDADAAEHGRHGPPVVRRGGHPWLPVRAGRARVRLAHAPLEHGRLRSPADR